MIYLSLLKGIVSSCTGFTWKVNLTDSDERVHNNINIVKLHHYSK